MTQEAPPHSRTKTVRGITLALAVVPLTLALTDHPLYGGAPGFGMTQIMLLVVGLLIAGSALLPIPWNLRLLSLWFSGFLTLFAAEVAGEFLLGARLRPPYELHETWIFTLKPGARSASTLAEENGGGVVFHTVNKDGFRGPDLLEGSPQPRIAVYGDSFIHAYYSEEEDTFARRLESALEERAGHDIEMINAGVSSYGPDQAFLKMRDELPVLKPDLIIFSIFAGNDFGDLLRNKLFRLDEDEELVPNAWTLDEDLRVNFELSHRGSIVKRALSRFLASDDTLGAQLEGSEDPFQNTLQFCLERARAEYDEFIGQGSNVVSNTQIDYYSADVSLEPDSPSAVYRKKLMAKIMEEALRTSEEAGVPLVFMIIPSPFNVCDSYGGNRVDTNRFPRYERRHLVDPLAETALRLGCPHVNLFDGFRAGDPESLYFTGNDDHWNVEGQARAAELMADYLASSKLIP